jgi:hypothetical protein
MGVGRMQIFGGSSGGGEHEVVGGSAGVCGASGRVEAVLGEHDVAARGDGLVAGFLGPD